MNILIGATCITGIVFMTVMLFIGIWLFIVALKLFNQAKYKNYILEKMYEKMGNETKTKIDFDEFKYFLELTKKNTQDESLKMNETKINNIKDFEKIR